MSDGQICGSEEVREGLGEMERGEGWEEGRVKGG